MGKKKRIRYRLPNVIRRKKLTTKQKSILKKGLKMAKKQSIRYGKEFGKQLAKKGAMKVIDKGSSFVINQLI